MSETLTTDELRKRHPLWPLDGEPDGDAILESFLAYLELKGIELYEAQEQAILEIFDDANIILKTPTGSGKSLVAAAMHYRSICEGRRSVYTCPIKALVNEKFLALCKDFGPQNVGISTGDATVNPGAPILCCTAEVLANQALCEGDRLAVDEVIMDEFHYYSDRDRGFAWQVPLLTLPQCRFLLISATLGETGFFEKELTRLTGARAATVASSERPVPLDFQYTEESLEDVLQLLHDQRQLPVYLVHFTQRQATESAQKLMSLNFCSKEDKQAIQDAIQDVPFNSPFGKDVRKFLRHGIGVHHAGMLPKYRILIERLAQENRLKVICGTDTLGVGVNVPIRTVLFTGLCKYDGEKVRIVPVRDFHQIAGRAGRKGFDDKGSVWVQAPEHVIENRKIERKIKENPAKARKLVKRKPPERGFVNWDEQTYERLVDSPPEPLVSSFKVSHGMLLNVLGRDDDGCAVMRQILRDCHETRDSKRQLGRRAFALFRSLVEKQIIEILPQREANGRKVQIHIDLQDDFSLDQTLSLFLVDTVRNLNPEDPEYPWLVLTLVESVLENPSAILRKQVDRLKTEMVREMKEQGIPYEERMEKLVDVEHPKPYRDFIYDTFNEFAAKHPWVGQDNIQPKSIGREMFERYLSFADYVRMYGLERSEGVLLRHLSNLYKTLTQSVPESAWTDEIRDMIYYFEQMVRTVDASLMEEWELLKDPEAVRRQIEEPEKPIQRPNWNLDPKRNADECLRRIRDAIFRFLQPLAQGNTTAASEVLAELAGRPAEDAAPPPVVSVDPETLNEGRGLFRWNQEALQQALEPYFESRERIRLDPEARNRQHTLLEQDPLSESWVVEQTLVDPESINDYRLRFRFDIEATQSTGEIHLHLDELFNLA